MKPVSSADKKNISTAFPPDSPRGLLPRSVATETVENTSRKQSAPASPRVTFGSSVHYVDLVINTSKQESTQATGVKPPVPILKSAPRVQQPDTASPRPQYPYPQLSRFSGTSDQFKALVEDYKGMADYFGEENVRKNQPGLEKALKRFPACREGPAICEKIAKKIRHAGRAFVKKDFQTALDCAMQAKEFDIALNTLLLGGRAESCSYDLQCFWECARSALEPSTAALSKLILLCDDAVNLRQFKPGTPRSRLPDTPDATARRRPSSAQPLDGNAPGAQINVIGANVMSPLLLGPQAPVVHATTPADTMLATAVPGTPIPVTPVVGKPPSVVFGPPPTCAPPPTDTPPPLPPQFQVEVRLQAESHSHASRPLPRKLFAEDKETRDMDDLCHRPAGLSPRKEGGLKRAAALQLSPQQNKLRHTANHHSPVAVREALQLAEALATPAERIEGAGEIVVAETGMTFPGSTKGDEASEFGKRS